MKKLLIISVLCLALSNVYAQSNNRIAVINFKANVGIMQSDVDGIASIFTTYFSPRGWQLVERTQIDKVISEQNFQKTSMTEEQMVQIGRILNLQKIVIGDVNMIAGGYNVDIRIVDVETGSIAAKDGETWNSGISYRELMQSLATRLASKIAIIDMPKQVTVSAPNAEANDVITLYGYLHIYPKNLGVFTSEPTSVISALNKNNDYGYNTWRLPTQEELELIFSNTNQVAGIDPRQPYMTKSPDIYSGRKIVRLVTTGKSAEETKKQMPSRTYNPSSDKSNTSDNPNKYRVGDLYDYNGVKGIVFEVKPDGKHGKILSMNICADNTDWSSANLLCRRLGQGWHLPTGEEITVITKNRSAINNGLLSNGGDELLGEWWLGDAIPGEPNAAMVVNMNVDIVRREYKSYKVSVRAVMNF